MSDLLRVGEFNGDYYPVHYLGREYALLACVDSVVTEERTRYSDEATLTFNFRCREIPKPPKPREYNTVDLGKLRNSSARLKKFLR